jgi:hypothetical protein
MLRSSIQVYELPFPPEGLYPFSKGKGKGKAVSLQPLTGPEGSGKFKLTDFETFGT